MLRRRLSWQFDYFFVFFVLDRDPRSPPSQPSLHLHSSRPFQSPFLKELAGPCNVYRLEEALEIGI